MDISGLGTGWEIHCEHCGKQFRTYSHKSKVCSTECRFSLYETRSDGCWNWGGPLGVQGYGVLFLNTNKKNGRREVTSAHRFAFQKYISEIPADKCVMHTCDNRQCTNPAHLVLGTWDENNKDRKSKGRNGVRVWTDEQLKEHGEKFTGEKNGFAILTEAQAKEIKYCVVMNRNHLAAKHGVSLAAVKAIRSGSNWKHI